MKYLKNHNKDDVLFKPVGVEGYSSSWKFVKKTKEGKVIFNNHTDLQVFTPLKQRLVRRMLSNLDIKIDLELKYTLLSLDPLNDALHDEIGHTKKAIQEIEYLINKPGSDPQRNKKRQMEVKILENHIRTVADYIK